MITLWTESQNLQNINFYLKFKAKQLWVTKFSPAWMQFLTTNLQWQIPKREYRQIKVPRNMQHCITGILILYEHL